MIPCQRDMFDLPENVAYLNCAYTSPLLKAAQQAGRTALQAKANPWTITAGDFFTTAETARELFAQLVGCHTADVALVPAVSYGMALAARNLPVARDQAIVILQDQFPSNVYAWMRVAHEKNAVVKTVQRPPDSDWTPAVLEAIDSDTAIVAVQNPNSFQSPTNAEEALSTARNPSLRFRYDPLLRLKANLSPLQWS